MSPIRGLRPFHREEAGGLPGLFSGQDLIWLRDDHYSVVGLHLPVEDVGHLECPQCSVGDDRPVTGVHRKRLAGDAALNHPWQVQVALVRALPELPWWSPEPWLWEEMAQGVAVGVYHDGLTVKPLGPLFLAFREFDHIRSSDIPVRRSEKGFEYAISTVNSINEISVLVLSGPHPWAGQV